jgi:hypothetical protein
MAAPKTPAHVRAEAVFKKQKAAEEAKEGTRVYESDRAAKLANMEKLRAQRLAREDSSGDISVTPKPKRKPRKGAEIAARTIDLIGDKTATPQERAKRKRRLLKGPKEFRGMRSDQRRRKPK